MVTREQLKVVPFLDASVLGERTAPLLPFWDGAEWHVWQRDPNGDIAERFKIVDHAVGRYFAKEPADPSSDGIFALLDFATRFAFFPDIVNFVSSIERDIHNLAASLWKTDLAFDVHRGGIDGADRLAMTEVEYVLTVCRSLLDLFQTVVARLWARVEVKGKRPQNTLPSSMSTILKLRTQSEIEEKLKVPRVLAAFYAAKVGFISRLKDSRDDVIHKTGEHILFRSAKGFSVDTKSKPFSELVDWGSTEVSEAGLGSLRFFLGSVILETFQVIELFATIMLTKFSLPGDLAPGYSVFLRGPHLSTLFNLDNLASTPWRRFFEPPLSIDQSESP